MSAICREFGISRKTGYKWLKREQEAGMQGLANRSCRPHQSPGQITAPIEARVLALREQYKTWGGRKIRRVMQTEGCERVPAASTITAILRRNQKIDPLEALKHTPFQHFEREKPNELWQMDFKGHFALQAGGYCHPLTVIDDYSRFLVGLKACPNQTYTTVQTELTAIFERFGLPERMLMDNGAPWGDDRETPYTILGAWLLRLDIAITHGRPYHPQTQGKDERLNRTLKDEVIRQQSLATLQESQTAFDDWWQTYNYIRPHDALQLSTPASRYQPSPRPFPNPLPPISYEPGDTIRKVDISGKIYFHNHRFRVGLAFRSQLVVIRSTEIEGEFAIFFCKQQVAHFSLRQDNLC
jgi:transposase InsO family protein